MKHYRVHAAVLLLAVAAFVAFAAAVRGSGQTQQQKVEPPAAAEAVRPNALLPTVATRERRAGEAAPDAALFAEAAGRNTALRFDLQWAFGGKQQRGWHLYVPLMSRLLDTDEDVLTGGFASAVARWQKSAGLAPSGVVDDETLYRMVSTWQGARLKEKGYPRPDQLLLAPTSDFYDPSRPEELRQVERETYAAYKRLVAAAVADPTSGVKDAADEKFLKIVSAFRSREYQERLRAQSPHSGRAGLAVNSPHFTGRALDLYVGGEPVETKDSNRALQVRTPAYRWLVRHAERFGFRPYYYEPWHWEYVGTPTAETK